MDSQLTLSSELRKLVEARIEHTLKGIEDTLQCIVEHQELSLKDLKEDIKSLEESFNQLSQKWNLEILYTLFLKSTINFSGLKKILGVNSRTLSDKLKSLKRYGYIERMVELGPPLRVEYTLTKKGRNIVLLALPLLYYSSNLISLKAASKKQSQLNSSFFGSNNCVELCIQLNDFTESSLAIACLMAGQFQLFLSECRKPCTLKFSLCL